MGFAVDSSGFSAGVRLQQPADAVSQQVLRILWLKTELLHPVDKGGKIRTIEMLRCLKRVHHITYLTLDDGTATSKDRADAQEYCHELVCIPFRPAVRHSWGFYQELLGNLFSQQPYAIARYRSEAMRRAIADKAASGAFDVIVCDFLVQAVNVPDELPVPVVLFQHNVEAMIWKRHAETASNALSRMYFGLQKQRMTTFERQACRRFDGVVAVSDDDCATMRRDYGIHNVASVPTGVDTNYFRPLGKGDAADRHGLVFTGSMDWMPNEDAMEHFLEVIFPMIRKDVPEATLTIVGRNPGARLCELAAATPGVVVTGRVADVRAYVDAAACFVVPIRIGGGTRLKIYEAMAMEKPVVSTTIGAEGLPVVDGTDLLIGDADEAFAAAVVRVLRDDGLARRLGAQAGETVRARFGWERVSERFSEHLHRALAVREPRATQTHTQSSTPRNRIE